MNVTVSLISLTIELRWPAIGSRLGRALPRPNRRVNAKTRSRKAKRLCKRAVFAISLMLAFTVVAAGEPLKRNPTPQDYIERNGGGASVVPAGRLVLDGHRVSCGHWATVLDPNLDDYAAAPYPQFIVLNMRYVAKVPTAVKLWIYNHECGHKFDGPNENKADCFAIRRGRSAGWLTPHGLDQVCGFIGAARADHWHLAGPERCALMRECYKKAATPKPQMNRFPLPQEKPSR